MLVDDSPVLTVFNRIIEPVIILGTFYVSAVLTNHLFTGYYLLTMIVVFFVSSFVYEQMEIYGTQHRKNVFSCASGIFLGWGLIVGILLLIANATGLNELIPSDVSLPWAISVPFVLLVYRFGVDKLARLNGRDAEEVRSAVIVGGNNAGADLHERIASHPISGIDVHGFFDDRHHIRQSPVSSEKHIGHIAEAAVYVRQHHVNLIFISMPMSTQPRLLSLLEELKDTTASIYFVPDIRNFEMIQGRIDAIDGLPLLGICESPFTGLNAVIKRVSDIVMAVLIQLILAPVIVLIAIGVKLSSPGPIIFSQRRYGLDGKEITVYKFRSMTVCEDGKTILQAQKNDSRITPFGKFLRRSSLDELPQFFNVLQGRMSIVGPRPHAIAHNELYRKLISGYMLRHKVKPGITGWAQVNGFRGETETLDKMRSRIQYDLEYLRNWSLLMDIWIIFLTIHVVMKRDNAY